MNTQHEHEHYPEDHHGDGEEGFDDHDHEGEDHQHEDDHQGSNRMGNHEILKLKLEVHLDRYERAHDDEEGKSPPGPVLPRSNPFCSYLGDSGTL
jgi:hypothetical protein